MLFYAATVCESLQYILMYLLLIIYASLACDVIKKKVMYDIAVKWNGILGEVMIANLRFACMWSCNK